MGQTFKKALEKKYNLPFNLSESTLSMILGGIVVVLVGLLAFNFFKGQREVAQVIETPEPTIVEKQVGQIAGGTMTVALPHKHVVSEGETIWEISEMYFGSGYNETDIIAANTITNPDVILVGQEITIPKTEPKERTTTLAMAPTEQPQTQTTMAPAAGSKIDGDKYTIMPGDDLWDISVRAYGDGYKWVELARVNKIANPNIIHADNTLTIPRAG